MAKKKYEGHLIKTVYPDSIAEELEVEVGDVLLTINNDEIEDVFDYRYLIKDEYIEVLIRKADGEEWLLEIDKEYEDDLGIEFDNSLMSAYRSCTNKCMFCFIDQMPCGMRDTLYFKDDDSRLSFLQGNYITLTNMKDKDIERIVRLHLDPINISIQSTNPELRSKMLNNRFAGEKLKYLDTLYEGQIEMNGQVVLCKGVNDGDELLRTINDLSAYLPFMRSVSVVPAGISKYRDGLYPLEVFTKEEAGQVIDMIESHQQAFYEEYGLHFIHASDEWYITAEREFPEEERYDGYIQLDNGVGMMRLFNNDFHESLEEVIQDPGYETLKNSLEKRFTIATGKLTYPTIQGFADAIMKAFPKVHIEVLCIRNEFFGETITVSGLITGQDLMKQVGEAKGERDLGSELKIPGNMLRSGEAVFLDDVTVDQLSTSIDMTVTPIEADGKDFLEAVLFDDYRMERDNENFVYIQAFKNRK